MSVTPVLLALALPLAAATVVWGRSAAALRRAWHKVDSGTSTDAALLARAAYEREQHVAWLYATATVVAVAGGVAGGLAAEMAGIAVVVPLVFTIRQRSGLDDEARRVERRASLERRALEVLSQDELAPRRWADRLAPAVLPEFEGFEVGSVYRAGTGLLAGDFYDIFRTGPHRLVAVVGDVTGHGIEPSITAFQTKYLLRVFCGQFRDPGQALTELNRQLAALGRPEELVSLVVAVFDTEVNTIRYASAGHPPIWRWHDREARPLRATGPLLTLDLDADYSSREIPLDPGDLLLLYTDGLTEARAGDTQFGEDRVGTMIRKNPGAAPQELCEALVEAATDFASDPIDDDVALLALRRLGEA